VLQSAKGAGGGWLDSDGDSSEDCATGLGEQQLALAIAQNGGLGLANMIAKGLGKK
jgi:Rod binding domain-containing protein